ncbi:MAG: type II secretion system protein GspL [Burkholderiaceae bacterium]
MSTLIVALPAEPPGPATEIPFVLTPDGQTAADHGAAAGALLPGAAQVVALVPADALSWHRATLPKGALANPARLRNVLEGILEDRLLDEPANLHFAVAPRAGEDGTVWVAVCDRAWLRAGLAALDAAQRPAGRIVPEFAPGLPAAAWVTGEPDDARWISTGDDGLTVLPFTHGLLSSGMLPATVAQEGEDAPEIFAEPGVAALAEQVLQRKVTLQQRARRWMEAAQSGWDLAQFDLASSGRARALRRVGEYWEQFAHAPQWRAARWGLALFAAANLVGLNAWAMHERSVLDAKRKGLDAVLTSTFPNVKVVVDAPLQMEREVSALRQASGGASGRDLETLLSALAISVPPGKALAGLEFANGELRARGLGLGAEEAANLSTRLRAMGYTTRTEGETLVVTQATATEARR